VIEGGYCPRARFDNARPFPMPSVPPRTDATRSQPASRWRRTEVRVASQPQTRESPAAPETRVVRKIRRTSSAASVGAPTLANPAMHPRWRVTIRLAWATRRTAAASRVSSPEGVIRSILPEPIAVMAVRSHAIATSGRSASRGVSAEYRTSTSPLVPAYDSRTARTERHGSSATGTHSPWRNCRKRDGSSRRR
jgi:hypothetical protein